MRRHRNSGRLQQSSACRQAEPGPSQQTNGYIQSQLGLRDGLDGQSHTRDGVDAINAMMLTDDSDGADGPPVEPEMQLNI